MSIMSEVPKESYIHRHYGLNGEVFERTMKERGATLDLCLSYADSLSKCGKVREALEVYDHCCRVGDISVDKLKHVTCGLLESMMNSWTPAISRNHHGVFFCFICEGVLQQPTTTLCGHTFCKKCLIRDPSRTCRKCGQKLSGNSSLETNILVKGIVEKFWSGELVAAELTEEGNELLQRNEFESSTLKFNEALHLVPDNHEALSSRSQALCKMGRLQGALSDAENVIKLRPLCGKGYHRRGSALLAMGHFEEALVSFCIFVALDKNPHAVRHDVCKILHSLLSNNLRSRHVSSSSPFAIPSQVRTRRSVRYFRHSSMLNTSDCEDHSSGDEDFIDLSTQPARSNFFAIIDHIFGELEKLKRVDWKPLDLALEQSLTDKTDFDCVLCRRTLWKPITTPCGHTYCSVCLDRSLDYSSACPLCMKSLSDYMAVTPKNETEFLCKALKVLLPAEYRARQTIHEAEVAELTCHEPEPRIPVFVCTTAYPSIHCPLFIFEPRYRLMVRRCIEAGSRQFGIAACMNTGSSIRRYADYGTILEIKDWVLMSDGCSILSTVGVRRFRTLSRGERDGYDTANVEFLIDEPISETSLPSIKTLHEKVRKKATSWLETFTQEFKDQVVSSFGTIPDVEENWTTLPDGPSWTWWLLAILPLGQQLQVSILGTTSLEKRLRAIDKTLNHIQERLQVPANTSMRSLSASRSSSVHNETNFPQEELQSS